jgi:uncharacterized protein (TIGR03437 family)
MSARALAFLLLASCEATAAVKLGVVREIGGSNIDSVSALTRDAAGNLYITGKTYSVDFPATTGQTRPGGSTLWRIDGGKQLNPLFGHGGVGVHALGASPSALYVHTGAALLKSTDSGATFSPCDATLPAEPLPAAIALDGNTVYLALPSSGIFKSTDGCLTFHASFQGIPSAAPSTPYPNQIAIDPFQHSTLFASTGFNLYRSDDSGATWQHQPLLRRNVVFDPSHPGVLYANDPEKNYRSADRGATWTALALPSSGGFPTEIGVDSQGNLYVNPGLALLVSSDGGASWTSRQTFGNAGLFTPDLASRTMYVVAGEAIFASNDGFVTYQTVEYFQIGGISALATAAGIVFTGNLTPTADAFVAKLDPFGNPVWATYLGGPYEDSASAIAVAPNGDVLVCGSTTTVDSFVARLSNDGALIYSKRFTDVNTAPLGIAADSVGNTYVTGVTYTYLGFGSGTLPVTPGAAQANFGAIPSLPFAPQPQDAFACKLAVDGSIVYCTYLGSGQDAGTTISVDAEGNAYVGGFGKLWKLNPSGSTILYTQTLTGAAITTGTLDAHGSWLVAGNTAVPEFPTTSGAFQRVLNARPALIIAGVLNGNTEGDGFVTRLDTNTGAILASTLLGGESSDSVSAIMAGSDGSVTVVGLTASRTFPLRAAFQASFADRTAFVARLNADLSALIFSTYAGDTRRFAAFGVALADDGTVWIAGDTAYPWGAGPFAGGAAATAQIFVTQLIPDTAAPPDVIAVLNSASLQGTTIAPSQIITVVAPGAGSDASVRINGALLPTLSSNNGVIVAQVPGDYQAASTVVVSVQEGNMSSAPLLMPGTIAAPAIYTQDGSGTGLGLIVNEDGSLNTSDNPAAQGSVISVACNGVGLGAPVNVYIDGVIGQIVGSSVQTLAGLPGAALILRVRIPAPDATHRPMPPIVSVMLNVGGVSNVSGILSPPYVAVTIKQ